MRNRNLKRKLERLDLEEKIRLKMKNLKVIRENEKLHEKNLLQEEKFAKKLNALGFLKRGFKWQH